MFIYQRVYPSYPAQKHWTIYPGNLRDEKNMPGSLSVDIMVETSQRPARELSPGWESELWQAPHKSKKVGHPESIGKTFI
jgi:hypothetical protein